MGLWWEKARKVEKSRARGNEEIYERWHGFA
jgi:hypothetical protein